MRDKSDWRDHLWLVLVTLLVLLIFSLGLAVGRSQGFWKGVAYTEARWIAQPTSP
jgi:hypothetical protein